MVTPHHGDEEHPSEQRYLLFCTSEREAACLRLVQIKGGWRFLHAPPTTPPEQREASFSTAYRSILLPPSGRRGDAGTFPAAMRRQQPSHVSPTHA